ncbi:MAG: hypothetical protein HY819_09090 [Acidobacteria bacterium]|nr:hypothetical protein [Acidobacteriota bacterium]
MHLVSDFDGVWTDPRAEADAIRDLMISRLIEVTDLSLERVKTIFSEIEQEFINNPFNYGWLFEGNITAYAMEDMYGRNHAIAIAIWDNKPGFEESGLLREAIVKISGDVDNFANDSFRDGRNLYRETNRSFLVPQAAEVVSKLRERGYKMTIVSNSKVTHILDLFEEADVSLDSFEVIGGARKFHLGFVPNVPETLDWQSAQVSLKRPHYLELLERLKPDAVIGDVFSLDLSLPIYLRNNREGWRHLRAGLITQPYTPSWVLGVEPSFAQEQGLDPLLDLAAIVKWLDNLG